MSAARNIARALAGGQPPHQLRDGSYLVCCPVPSHGRGRGDHNPSLRLTDGDTRLLVHCYSGCDRLAVLDELRRRGLLNGVPTRSPFFLATDSCGSRRGRQSANAHQVGPRNLARRTRPARHARRRLPSLSAARA